jgi:hypothetical protein
MEKASCDCEYCQPSPSKNEIECFEASRAKGQVMSPPKYDRELPQLPHGNEHAASSAHEEHHQPRGTPAASWSDGHPSQHSSGLSSMTQSSRTHSSYSSVSKHDTSFPAPGHGNPLVPAALVLNKTRYDPHQKEVGIQKYDFERSCSLGDAVELRDQ